MGRVPFWGLNSMGVSCNEDLLYYPDPWDTFWINDDNLPGKCWLENKDIATIEVEKKKGKNSSGARISFFGYLPGGFDLLVRIATPEQWDVFLDLEDKYWAGPTKAARPPQITVKVTYPDLDRLKVYQAVLVGVPLAESSDIEGAKNFRFKFHEQVKQRPHKAKSAGGAVPISNLRPSVDKPLNAPHPMPSTNPANLGLSGPKLTANPGAL